MLEACIPHVDALEIVPDCIVDSQTGCIDRRYVDQIREHASVVDLYSHGIGLSIATVDGWNTEALRLIESVLDNFDVRWISEHLGYTTVDGHFLGCMPAAPRTSRFVDLIAARVNRLRELFAVEICMELVASPIDSGGDLSHARFLNQITEASNSGVILDLHNLECEADNGRVVLDEFFDEVEFTRIREIHVAGGIWRDGLHLDVLARPCAPSTLELLDTRTYIVE